MFLTHILSVCVPESVRDFFYTNCHKVEYQFVCTVWMNAALSVVNKIMLYNSNNTHTDHCQKVPKALKLLTETAQTFLFDLFFESKVFSPNSIILVYFYIPSVPSSLHKAVIK